MKHRQHPNEETLTSIIVPTYNRRGLLLQAVESCLSQTWKNIEIVIVDDGSSDGTNTTISQMLDNQWSTRQISYIRQKNQGASAARNQGLKVARGKYVQFLDSDDLLMSTKIAKQVREMEKPENAAAVCCYCFGTMAASTEGDAPKSEIGLRRLLDAKALASELSSKIVHGMPTPSPLWRRSHLMKHAGWREDISLGDDLEYYIRLLADADKVCFIDEELFFVREHIGPRLSTGRVSAASLMSLIRTRQAILSTLRQSGLWNAQTQCAFLGAMRTIYANALQLGNHETIRDLEEWLWTLADGPEQNREFHALILLRRMFGRRLLLGAHKLTNALRPS